MAKKKGGNLKALTKEHISKRDFIFWWEAAPSVDSFVDRAKRGGFEVTSSSAIARAGRLRKSTTKSGRPKTAYPLKWMGSSPQEDEAQLLADFLAFKEKKK
jgi:hypothetical protein|tara:strand:- start:2223 stop:2525 length:303 start_codon:yes stop_codon:yes gene_type:complete